ncbi:MAG: fatty oxidation complex subunit alpha, partial [Halobacteriovoraceae bacterium]|nr:fatty oxidation complex subunit alpha [Halobacteriovoraceae bacterium]
MNTKRISYEVNDKIAYCGFGFNCDKSMTVLDEETLTELKNIIEELGNRSSELEGAVFFSHKKRCFLAGADINLIGSMKTESEGAHGAEQGQTLYNALEDLSIPTVVCVHGVCLGGGTEFSLACNSIIVSDDSSTMMGLPEVKLGLIPGWGGTFRMPRRIGLPKALDLILSGKTVKGKKAKRMGLADGIYPRERLLKQALFHLKGDDKKKTFKDSLENFASDNFLSRKIIFQKARESVLKKTKGFYQAPLKILDTMEAGMMKGRSSYLSSEAQAFGELCVSEQSRNLQHIFFLMENAKKFSGPKGNGELPKTDRGAVLGAGTMGGGIAWLMADNGMRPIMKDITVDALNLGLKQSSSNFSGAVKRKKMTPEEFERKQRSILAQLDFRGFQRTDLLIEAVVENMEIKKKVFAEAETYMSENALLTSNTSSLSVEEMSKALERPERFAGLHFFNPVHRMP